MVKHTVSKETFGPFNEPSMRERMVQHAADELVKRVLGQKPIERDLTLERPLPPPSGPGGYWREAGYRQPVSERLLFTMRKAYCPHGLWPAYTCRICTPLTWRRRLRLWLYRLSQWTQQ